MYETNVFGEVEVEKRKEALWLNRTSNYRQQSTKVKLYISEIDPSLLTHHKQTESYLGRGAFGILQIDDAWAMYAAACQSTFRRRPKRN